MNLEIVQSGGIKQGEIKQRIEVSGLAAWAACTTLGAVALFYLPGIVFAPMVLISLGPVWMVALALGFAGLIGGAIVGALVGVGQQKFVLRSHVTWAGAGRWVKVTALGWGMSAAIALVFTYCVSEVLNNGFSYLYGLAWIAGAAGMGFSQWLLLRTLLPKATWWVAITTLAWAAGILTAILTMSAVTGASVDEVIRQSITSIFSSASTRGFLGFAFPPSFWTLAGSVSGVITGLALRTLTAKRSGESTC
ncbi:MAG TPA: hypothetical protein VF826_05835 [Chloroflexia bacterium]|jgi:hypothetical protein